LVGCGIKHGRLSAASAHLRCIPLASGAALTRADHVCTIGGGIRSLTTETLVSTLSGRQLVVERLAVGDTHVVGHLVRVEDGVSENAIGVDVLETTSESGRVGLQIPSTRVDTSLGDFIDYSLVATSAGRGTVA